MVRRFVFVIMPLVALTLVSSFVYAADFAARYYGGADNDRAQYVKVDADGNVIFAGTTNSRNLPVTPGAIATTIPADKVSDIYIAKYSNDLKTLLKATYLGVTCSNNDTNLQALKVNSKNGDIALLTQWGGDSNGGKVIKLSKDFVLKAASATMFTSNGWLRAYDIDFKPFTDELYVVGTLGKTNTDALHFDNFSGTETILMESDDQCINPRTCGFVVKLSSNLKAITAATVL